MSEFDLTGGVGAGEAADGMVFNLDNVSESTTFELIPKGTYDAVVEDFTFGESSKGNAMITVVYSLLDPEYENRKLYDYMVLTGDGKDFGLQKVKKFLVRVMPEQSISNFNPQSLADSGDAIGRECRVSVKIQTQKSGDYKGEKRNQVADILAPENGSFI